MFAHVCILERWIYRRDEIRRDSPVSVSRAVFTLPSSMNNLSLSRNPSWMSPYCMLVPVPLTTSQDGYPRRAFHGIRWMENFRFTSWKLSASSRLILVNYRLVSPAVPRLHRWQRNSIHEGHTSFFLFEIDALLCIIYCSPQRRRGSTACRNS